VEDPKKLKALLEGIFSPNSAQATNPAQTVAFNNQQMQAQAASPSLDTGNDNIAPPMNPAPMGQTPQELAVEKEIEAQSKEALLRQKLELERQRELNKIYSSAGAGYADLSPTLNLASQMTGIDVSKGYVAPMTVQDAAKQAMDMEGRMPKLEDSMADNQLNLLRMKLQSAQRKGDAGREARFQQGQDSKFFTDFRKDSQKIAGEIADAKTSITNVGAAIEPDEKGMVDAARVQMALSNFARLMGEKGVLTDQDTGRQLAPMAALQTARVKQWFTANPGATKVPASVVSAMTEALEEAKNALTETAKTKLSTLETTYGEPTAPTANMYYYKGGKKIADALKTKLEKTLFPDKANAKEPSLKDILMKRNASSK
jgi:hypothetical protein